MDEIPRRRQKLDQIRRAAATDPAFAKHWAQVADDRAVRRAEAIALIRELDQTRDVTAFRSELDKWTNRPGFDSFGGFSMMFMNQLWHRSEPDRAALADLLVDVLIVPTDEAQAEIKIKRFVGYVNGVKKGSHPAPGRVPFVLSIFWSIQHPDAWPALWASSEEGLVNLGWLKKDWEQHDRYLRFRRLALELEVDLFELESLLFLVQKVKFVGLEPALRERCMENASLLARALAKEDYAEVDKNRAELNARILRAEFLLLAAAAEGPLGEAMARTFNTSKATLQIGMETGLPYRADAYAALALPGGINSPSVRIWGTQAGVAIGLHAGWSGEGWHDRIGRELSATLPPGLEFLRVLPHAGGSRLEPAGTTYPGGEVFIGRWMPGDEAIDSPALLSNLLATAKLLRPVLDSISSDRATPSGSKPTAQAATDALAPLVTEFLARPYPNEKDQWHLAERQRLAAALDQESLLALDVDVVRQIINGPRYGKPGPMALLNTTVSAAEAAGSLDEIAKSLHYLLWGEDDDAKRIDRLLDQADLGFPGLGESVVMKLLAIVHPKTYLPVFPYAGSMGKFTMLKLLDLPLPNSLQLTKGQVHVEANARLRARLEPLLPDDPWGQAQFLYWLKARTELGDETTDLDPLDALADDLLVERSFLDDIVALLRDKGQVVFYGPPGTGKTFLAKKLAAALAPDSNRRMIVQFHPSTSYEDFFEGYRPSPVAGEMRYDLVRGPLALLADAAENSPADHVLVIDEINRANLPRVLGELLFLLEYRNESVRPLYRPDEAFELPPNLFIIGTMNTADRSVALVDAALRRRFHFVPFLPNEGPMEGLLGRWFEKQGGPAWVADLVDMVNEELRERLGGPHLQIGPSHFMTSGLDEEKLRRIWTYNIYPFIEEQLYGEWAVLQSFRYEAVKQRYDKSAIAGTTPAESTDETAE